MCKSVLPCVFSDVFYVPFTHRDVIANDASGCYELRMTFVGPVEYGDNVAPYPHKHGMLQVYHTASGKSNAMSKLKILEILNAEFPDMHLPYLEPTKDRAKWYKYCHKTSSVNPDAYDVQLQVVVSLVNENPWLPEKEILAKASESIGMFKAMSYKPLLSMMVDRAIKARTVIPQPTTTASSLFMMFLSMFDTMTFTVDQYPTLPQWHLKAIALYHWLIFHVTPRMSGSQDFHLGLMFQGPAGCGKSTLVQYMPYYAPARDSAGVGIFQSNLPVYLFDDLKAQWLLKHADTIRPLAINTPVSVKVHSSTVTLSGKWLIATTNDDMALLPLPDRRRWIVCECVPLLTPPVPIHIDKQEFISHCLTKLVDFATSDGFKHLVLFDQQHVNSYLTPLLNQ